MDIQYLKSLNFNEIKSIYKNYLLGRDYSTSTINTAISDTFYIWRHGSRELFWEILLSNEFELKANILLEQLLVENSKSDLHKSINGYKSHLRRFRLFLDSDGPIQDKNNKLKTNTKKQIKIKEKKKKGVILPRPSKEEVDKYLNKWIASDNYPIQEKVLNKLFFELCPKNNNLEEILLKVKTLNDFYSTNIFKIYPVAELILNLDIDSRLYSGDVNLVMDIQHVTYGNVTKNFYSFATKFCSHHNPIEFPIYDSFVDRVLKNYRNYGCFTEFQDGDLKDYPKFKKILLDFRDYYGLNNYNLKQIDQYLWQLGKDYFPKDYKNKKAK